MNRNVRRIALSLVAIVLGAGYLLKVIPPETDVGIDENYSVSIDGSLITNPLDINEKIMPISQIPLYGSSNTSSPLAENSGHNEGPTTEIQSEQIAIRKPSYFVRSEPDATSNENEVFPPSSLPKALPKVDELPTSIPATEDFLESPVYPGGPKPSISTPRSGSGPIEIPDDERIGPGPSPRPEVALENPVHTDEDQSELLIPPFSPETPLQPPPLEEFPAAALPPYFEADGPTKHAVPDLGGTLLLLTLSLGSAALIREIISSKKNGGRG